MLKRRELIRAMGGGLAAAAAASRPRSAHAQTKAALTPGRAVCSAPGLSFCAI